MYCLAIVISWELIALHNMYIELVILKNWKKLMINP